MHDQPTPWTLEDDDDESGSSKTIALGGYL